MQLGVSNLVVFRNNSKKELKLPQFINKFISLTQDTKSFYYY